MTKGQLLDTDPRSYAAALFSSLTCEDIIHEQVPVYIPASVTVQQACRILTEHGIHFAPVVGEKGNFAGVFTFRSLCSFVLQNFSDTIRSNRMRNKGCVVTNEDFDLRLLACSSVGPERSVLDYARVDDFVHCLTTDCISDITISFRHGWHRVSAFNLNGEFVGVVTQAKVLKVFIESVGNLDKVFPQTICELFPKCCDKFLVSISEHASVFSALRLMYESNVSALAVTSSSGKLVSAISMEDIREIFRTKQLRMLFSQVRRFGVYVRSQHTTEYSLLAVHEHSKVSHAIQKMMTTKPHRVWIVDSDNCPIGVLSVSDIIEHLFPWQ